VEFEAAAGFGVAEDCSGGVVENERRLEGGAGEAVLDAGNFFPEIEAPGLGLGWIEETPHATAKVGGLGEVGSVFGTGAAEGEDSRLRGDGAQDFVGLLRRKGYDVIELEARGHRRIVDVLVANCCMFF
jgi:hypothetical protein